MSRARLTPFSYVILVLVGRNGAGPHDLVRMMRQGRVYWTAAESQYYAEPKRLEKLGYLSSRKEPGRTRERTHYELTGKGREALAEWVAQPAPLPKIQSEPVVRLMATDLVEPERVLEGLAALRAEIDEQKKGLEVGESIAAELPHRERYLRINHRLARAFLDAHLEWLEQAERELKDGR
ncbi:MAG TPA: PadR family transcriptional regulator [Thermoleophilaceae bacterium]|jgi:DNA-binding PadR family transcriptional regulator